MPDENRVIKNQPLDFVLYYQNYVNLYTIYLDDGYEAKELYLDIFNQSEHQIQLAAPGTEAQRKTKSGCHFYLTVPRNILALDGTESLISDNDWQVKYVKGTGRPRGGRRGNTGNTNDTLYFSRNTAHTIASVSSEDQDLSQISLILKNLQASATVELRSSEVSLSYGGLTTYKEPIDSALQNVNLTSQGYDHTLFVVNHLGKKNIPLHAAFTGSNTILNDGGTANELQLQITNIQDSNNPRPNLAIGKQSRFIISFESGTTDKEWALGTENQVGAIGVDASDTNNWQVEKTANKSEWIVTPQLENNAPKKAFLEIGEEIAFDITNIQSNHPSGQTKLTVRYQEIPDYWDGDLVCIIEKTPLMYRSPLKATANNQVLTAVRIKTNFDDNAKSGVKHVGLAVESGDLKVKDNFYVESGNVGIGIDNPTEKLHVEGNIQTNNAFIGSAHSGRAGFSHKDSSTSGGYALIQDFSGRTLLNAASGQIIEFCINNSDKMTLDSSGKLGIGTTSPTEKLEVLGNVKVQDNLYIETGKVSIGVATTKARLHVKGSLGLEATSNSELWNLNVDNNGNLNFNANNYAGGDTRMFIDDDSGSVGIGTTSPSQKLEVAGKMKAEGLLLQSGSHTLNIYWDGYNWIFHASGQTPMFVTGASWNHT